MARFQRLPAGLPPHLVNRIARSGAGGVGYEPGLGALGFSLKKLVKGVTKTVTKAANIAVAPVKIGVVAPLKAVTWAAAQTGVKPLQKLDSAVRSELKTTVKDAKTAAVIGAGVGLTIVSGGSAASALIPAGIELLQASLPKKAASVPPDVQMPVMASMAEQASAYAQQTAQVDVAQGAGIDPNTGRVTAASAAGVPAPGQALGPPQGAPGQPGASNGSNLPLIVGGVAAAGILLLLLMPRRREG